MESEPVDATWRFREKRRALGRGSRSRRTIATSNIRAREGTVQDVAVSGVAFAAHPHADHENNTELYHLDLQPREETEGSIHVGKEEPEAREDKSVDFKIDMEQVPIGDWVPDNWREHVSGNATAKIHWTGKDPKMASSGGDATLRIDDGAISALPFLQKVAALANDKSLERIRLNVCQLDVEWRYPKFDVTHLVIEEKGKFSREGEVIAGEELLRGTVERRGAALTSAWLAGGRRAGSLPAGSATATCGRRYICRGRSKIRGKT